MQNDDMLIEVRDLKTYFELIEGTVRAVDGTNFSIRRGQTVGIVGESGCGKSVTARSILRIVPDPGRIVAGEILYYRRLRGTDGSETYERIPLTALQADGREMRGIRGSEIAMVFQEPMTSLSPVHTIGNQIEEVLILHQKLPKKEAEQRAAGTLARVGMPQPVETLSRYPHELSGGMRQRAMIAMALSCGPSLLIADEPTTALDVTTQAQIIELMKELQADLGMAIMYITHDLGVIAEMTNQVVVMYLGRDVETADVVNLFHDPLHPYTRALLRSIPKIDAESRERLDSIVGVVPDPYSVPRGCPFHPRCPSAIEGQCEREDPPIYRVEERKVRCHLYEGQATWNAGETVEQLSASVRARQRESEA
jgi:oligopeptide/dipeptide ABC transporter ATP-binding protein